MPKNFSFFAQTHCHHVQYVNILATLCPSCLCSTVSLTYNLPDSALSTGLLFCVSFLNYLISSIRLSSLEQESFLTGKDIQFRRSKTWCHPPHPSSTSGTLHNPAPTSKYLPNLPSISRTQKKKCAEASNTCLQALTPTTTMFLTGAGRPPAQISAVWYPEITVCSNL